LNRLRFVTQDPSRTLSRLDDHGFWSLI
jgi:hypothetical protein